MIEEYEPKKKKSSQQRSEFAQNLQRSMNKTGKGKAPDASSSSTRPKNDSSIKLREELSARDIKVRLMVELFQLKSSHDSTKIF